MPGRCGTRLRWGGWVCAARSRRGAALRSGPDAPSAPPASCRWLPAHLRVRTRLSVRDTWLRTPRKGSCSAASSARCPSAPSSSSGWLPVSSGLGAWLSSPEKESVRDKRCFGCCVPEPTDHYLVNISQGGGGTETAGHPGPSPFHQQCQSNVMHRPVGGMLPEPVGPSPLRIETASTAAQ